MTLEELKSISPSSIFSGGLYLSTRWIAKRGVCWDWAIYYGPLDWSPEKIAKWGNKMKDDALIRQLVPCDDEAFEMYRY